MLLFMKMVKYRIIFDREKCIGALSCVAVHPALWIPTSDGKVDMKNAVKRPDGKWEIIVEEEEYPVNKEAAEVCPVNVIVVEKIE